MWSAVASQRDDLRRYGRSSHRFSTVFAGGAFAFVARVFVPRVSWNARALFCRAFESGGSMFRIVGLVLTLRHRTPHALLGDQSLIEGSEVTAR
jgi:hypothetical protein